MSNDSKAIGTDMVDNILIDAGRALSKLVRDYDSFEDGEGVYRINDLGEYVSAYDFETYWEQFPEWYRMAWMLADNGQYSFDDVAAMTIEEVEAAYKSPDFYPEYAFYTEI